MAINNFCNGDKCMKLYHGSNTIVDKPTLVVQNRFLDFGYGFYTTANREQAEKFAHKIALNRGGTPKC